jgi:alpha-tubulin suppressor-like RCC1 family protein
VWGLTSGVANVAAGDNHTCAVVNGGLKCWGDNETGQLGDNTTAIRHSPVQVAGLTSGVTAVTAGTLFTCALVNGGVQCWGRNNWGQLGDNLAEASSLVPVQVVGLTSGVTAVAAGFGDACALVNGGVQCWGYNNDGELGDNSTIESHVPVQVQFP